MTRYAEFDRSLLVCKPLAERDHDLNLGAILELAEATATEGPLHALIEGQSVEHLQSLRTMASRMVAAARAGRSVIFSMGAHVLRAGVVRYLVDLMDRGIITHIATNGACTIHDFEFALVGGTSESVPRYISQGQFGLWKETGRLNDIAKLAAKEGLGLGEAIGREILNGEFPNKDISLFAQAYQRKVPVTVHVGIGYDIVHEHENCDGAAWGAASYRDFLIFTQAVTGLEGGAFLNFGSSVMGPEVYLKALAMARNVAHQRGEQIRKFSTLVCDLIPISGDPKKEASKSDPQYYYRPYKTILVRTVADGGESSYVQGDHRWTVPALHRFAMEASKSE